MKKLEIKLAVPELKHRDRIIENGIRECRDLLGKQTSRLMYFFYEGSIDGFEECRKINSFEAYEQRLDELNKECLREVSCSSLRRNDDEIKLLRERLGIYGDESTDDDKVYTLKGMKKQIEYVYDRLLAHYALINSSAKNK